MNDLKSAHPTRNTVRSTVGQMASDVRNIIRSLMGAAKAPNGIAATTDCWTDSIAQIAGHGSYICITLHVSLIEINGINHYRYVMYMDSVKELSKKRSYYCLST